MLSLLSLLHSRPTTPLVAPSLALFSSATAAAAAMAKQRNLGVQKVAAARGGAAPQPVTAAELLATISAAADVESHAERSWAYFRSLGSPKWHVAPMVDQSELPFRMLCRAHGAEAAYTPMLHARLFLEHEKYRDEHFTTCEGDRPLFVQFCANDPDVFVRAASMVQAQADYIDLNLGCPQRIAKRGYYGAFLMDDLGRVADIVAAGASRLAVPVSVKIRLFPDLQDTIAYARMLEAAGCSLLAVHGRTRDMKDHAAHRADWAAIAAVRAALRIPVLANGDVRCLAEARALMEATGAAGVMSAEPLLINPALFNTHEVTQLSPMDAYRLCCDYLERCAAAPTHTRMVRGHVHKLITGWLAEFTDLRIQVSTVDSSKGQPAAIAELQQVMVELGKRIAATGRDHPVPQISERKLAALEREAAKAAAIAEQEREAAGLAAIGAGDPGSCDGVRVGSSSSGQDAGAEVAAGQAGGASNQQQQEGGACLLPDQQQQLVC